MAGDLYSEASRASKDFNHAIRTHPTKQRLVCQSSERGATIPVEHFLTSANLVPVNPTGNIIHLIPELPELLALVNVVSE